MKSDFICVEGSSIFTQFYHKEYNPDKETIVFLHEALGSVAQWRDFPKEVGGKTDFNVLAYDRLGHGLSDAPVKKRDLTYLHTEAWTALPSVLAAFDIKKPILYGHSDGGSIALLYAARFPTRAIITEAAHVFVESVTLDGIKQAVTRRDFLIEKLTRFHGNKTPDLWAAWADTWLHKSFETWNIEAVLNEITCPSLIIQGKNDEYGTAEQVRRIAKGIGENVEILMLPHCGHAPHKETQKVVLDNVLKFLTHHV